MSTKKQNPTRHPKISPEICRLCEGNGYYGRFGGIRCQSCDSAAENERQGLQPYSWNMVTCADGSVEQVDREELEAAGEILDSLLDRKDGDA